MDEIQRKLKSDLAVKTPEAMREKLFNSLPEGPVDLEFVLDLAIKQSETNSWWYDTLVEYARRLRRPAQYGELVEPPGNFTDWCIGVTAKDIRRPRQRGRPMNHMRDLFICDAIEAYRKRAREGEPISHGEACGRVADAVGLDDSVVAKIWRRWQRQ